MYVTYICGLRVAANNCWAETSSMPGPIKRRTYGIACVAQKQSANSGASVGRRATGRFDDKVDTADRTSNAPANDENKNVSPTATDSVWPLANEMPCTLTRM